MSHENTPRKVLEALRILCEWVNAGGGAFIALATGPGFVDGAESGDKDDLAGLISVYGCSSESGREAVLRAAPGVASGKGLHIVKTEEVIVNNRIMKEKEEVERVPDEISAKMKELEGMCSKAGVNLLCVACTGAALTHYVNGDTVPLTAALVTIGERYQVIREVLKAAADSLRGDGPEVVDRISFRPLGHSVEAPDAFDKVTEEMHRTWKAKNADYGCSFDDGIDRFGLVSAAVRICDKANRFASLADGKEALVKGESIRDTLMDLANYCVMTVMRLDRDNGEG